MSAVPSPPPAGHNSATTEAAATRSAKDHLRLFVERVEKLESEKKTIADDIREVYAEAKGSGFDTKALRQVVKLRKMDKDERAENDAMLSVYLTALGMI